MIDKQGVLTDVQWDGPTFKAGLGLGAKLIALNNEEFHAEDLKDAIKAKVTPLELLVKDKNQYRTVRIDYADGARYPKLERVAGTPARLDDILEPRSP